MMINDKWREICALIEQDIMDGVLEPGAKIPTEPELAALYQVGRHSIRRAVAELAKTGHVSIQQGRGTFVLPRPKIEYTIGRRTRLRRNLHAQGVDVTSELLGVDLDTATDLVADRLGLAPGAEVLVTRRKSFADGVPLSFGTLYHDAKRFADFSERRQKMGSVSAVYASYGIDDYLRGHTEIHSRPATRLEVETLNQHPDMPVMVLRAVDQELDGTPLAYSEVIWSAARVSFNIPLDGGGV